MTQGLSIYYNAKTNINANNNATALGINTNATFGQFAAEINSPVVVQPEPIVVTQPEPIVVTQPEPIVVTQPEPIVVEHAIMVTP